MFSVHPCSPYQMEPNSYPCHYHSGCEVRPPQMGTDSFKHPSVMPYPFSFGNNMCWPNSSDHGSCCHQSCSPGHYSFRPQFSHLQPAPQMYFHGPYPPYLNPYPAFFVPPPHYSIDQARYDYEKGREHCCGCSNHRCHRRDENSPKLEGQEPDKAQNRDYPSQIRVPNYPSSIWVPSSSIKDREEDKASRFQPGCWNDWVPLDINGQDRSRQDHEGKKVQGEEVHRDEDKLSQKRSPFPIIWMPDYDKPEQSIEDLKGTTPISVEDWPSKLKIIPCKLLENENNVERQKTELPESQAHAETQVAKEGKIKTIPVKKLEDNSKKSDTIDEKQVAYIENNVERQKTELPESQGHAETQVPKEGKIKTIPVKKLEDNSNKADTIDEKQVAYIDEKRGEMNETHKEKGRVDKTSEKKESSPVRPSKLPPVCLRVDPLPRKKKNCTSRSLSAPGQKDTRNHEQKEEQIPQRERREETTEKIIPVVNVKNSIRSQPGMEQKCQQSASVASLNDSSKEPAVQEPANPQESLSAKDVDGSQISGDSRDCMSAGDTGRMEKMVADDEPRKSSDSEKVKDKRGMKRNLSESDAALIIQSAYRGYEVRRWCPLEKLQKIAKVRQKVDNLRKQLQNIEASSEQLDAKQRVVICETIMNLLMELDTIQGLHPSIREVRKSVAKELVCLQERVDSLVGQIAEEHEPMYVEVDGKTIEDAAFVGSGADKQQPVIGESLEDKISNSGDATTKKSAEDVCLIHLPSNERVDVVGASVSRLPTTEQQLVQPLENSGGEAGLSSNVEVQEADRSDADTTIFASSCVISEPVFDQGTGMPIESELPSELVRSENKNGALENPSLEGKKPEFNEDTLADSTLEASTTASGGPVSAAFLVNNDQCVIGGSGYLLSGTGEEVDSVVPGEALVSVGVADLSEPSAGSDYYEHQAAAVDPRGEDDAVLLHQSEEAPIKISEQGSKLGQIALPEDERANLAFNGALRSIMSVAQDEMLETEATSSPKQRLENSRNAKEEISMLLPVDGDDRMNTSLQVEDDDCKDLFNQTLPMEADIVKETRSENLKVCGFSGVAEGNAVEELKISAGGSESNDEKRLKASVAGSNEKGPNAVGDKIEGSTRDECLQIYKDAAKGDEVGGPGWGTHALHPSQVLEAVSEEAGEVACPNGGNTASKDMNKQERTLLEENEKLREMLQKLLDAGKQQLGVISELNGRVKDLEKKLAVPRRVTRVKRDRIRAGSAGKL